MKRIPIDAVAEDARWLVQAFRDKGEMALDDVPLDQARADYRSACATNGLPSEDVPIVRDHMVAVDGGGITVREYRPTTDQGILPALLFIHGGGWVIGDLETHDGFCRALALGAGISVFAVDYRRAPEHRFPVPLSDCGSALSWLAENADRLRIDPARIGGCGDSAGGNLIAVMANEAHWRPANFEFKALALFYPVTDLRRQSWSYSKIKAGFALTARTMDWFAEQYLPLSASLSDPQISPLLSKSLCQAPLFILGCGLDPLAEDAIAYATASARGGAFVEHHHLPHHPHGIVTSAGKIATAASFVKHAARFFRTML